MMTVRTMSGVILQVSLEFVVLVAEMTLDALPPPVVLVWNMSAMIQNVVEILTAVELLVVLVELTKCAMIQNAVKILTVMVLLAVLVEQTKCAMILTAVKILTVMEALAVPVKTIFAMIQNVVMIQTVLMSLTRSVVCVLMILLAADLSAVLMKTVMMGLFVRTNCVYLKENVMLRGHVRVPMRSAMFLNMITANTVMRKHILQSANLAVLMMPIVLM